MNEVIHVLKDRMYHTHIKNGYIDAEGGWHFQTLDEGLINYPMVLNLLHRAGYAKYLSIECLSSQANERPVETARRDFEILTGYLGQ